MALALTKTDKSFSIPFLIMTVVIPTLSARHLARKMRKHGVKVLYSGKNKDGERYFPDGELYTRIPLDRIGLKDEVVLLYSGQPEPDKNWRELFAITYALEDDGITPNIVCSYLDCGRQDKNFERGEPNMAKHMIEDLSSHFKSISVVDYHPSGKWVEDYGVGRLSMVSLLKDSAEKKYRIERYVSPDKGGEKRTGIKGANKERLNSKKVVMDISPEMLREVKGENVGVVDDIISGGGTMCSAYEKLKSAGADKVIALATHGVMESGVKRVKDTFDDLFLSNTIKTKYSNVDVTELIVKNIV